MSALVLGFVGAMIAAACGPNKPTPKPGLDPGLGVPPECNVKVENPCKRYKIPLLDNPSTNEDLRNAYIAAFGDACYMSDATEPTFNCFYRKENLKKACEDAAKISEVAGYPPYKKGYMCKPVEGTDNFWLQTGDDEANNITITWETAPRQTPKIDVGGVPTEVNGPYRNVPEPEKVEPGRPFTCTNINYNGAKIQQRQVLLQVNRNKNGGEVKSDLAGFTWPCEKNGTLTTCTEEEVLKDPNATPKPSPNDPNFPEVHHVVRATDLRGCKWGTNSNKNAAIISKQLNIFLRNKTPSAAEITQVNGAAPYPP